MNEIFRLSDQKNDPDFVGHDAIANEILEISSKSITFHLNRKITDCRV